MTYTPQRELTATADMGGQPNAGAEMERKLNAMARRHQEEIEKLRSEFVAGIIADKGDEEDKEQEEGQQGGDSFRHRHSSEWRGRVSK